MIIMYYEYTSVFPTNLCMFTKTKSATFKYSKVTPKDIT